MRASTKRRPAVAVISAGIRPLTFVGPVRNQTWSPSPDRASPEPVGFRWGAAPDLLRRPSAGSGARRPLGRPSCAAGDVAVEFAAAAPAADVDTEELPASTCCHTFRATGITAYLSNEGTLEHAQQIAGQRRRTRAPPGASGEGEPVHPGRSAPTSSPEAQPSRRQERAGEEMAVTVPHEPPRPGSPAPPASGTAGGGSTLAGCALNRTRVPDFAIRGIDWSRRGIMSDGDLVVSWACDDEKRQLEQLDPGARRDIDPHFRRRLGARRRPHADLRGPARREPEDPVAD